MDRCLIVDDNERFLAVAQQVLEREGMDVVGTATTQAEALRQVDVLRPDIVLVDISLGTDSGVRGDAPSRGALTRAGWTRGADLGS